jgi:hypothetical protein
MVGSTLGIFTFGLIFVSARTNKRHHHHHARCASSACASAAGKSGFAMAIASSLADLPSGVGIKKWIKKQKFSIFFYALGHRGQLGGGMRNCGVKV